MKFLTNLGNPHSQLRQPPRDLFIQPKSMRACYFKVLSVLRTVRDRKDAAALGGILPQEGTLAQRSVFNNFIYVFEFCNLNERKKIR